jgi:hypothetical protein
MTLTSTPRPDLSVKQHLEFYCLLKGVPIGRKTVAARKLAEKVELAIGVVQSSCAPVLTIVQICERIILVYISFPITYKTCTGL